MPIFNLIMDYRNGRNSCANVQLNHKQITSLETSRELMLSDLLKKASDQKPIDQEQFLIEHNAGLI